MSTHVRIILDSHGSVYTGRRIRQVIEKLAAANKIEVPVGLKFWERVIYVFKRCPKDPRFKLMVFREPRKLNRKKSRYIKTCGYLGCGARIYRMTPPPVERTTNGGTIRHAGTGRGNNPRNVPPRVILTQAQRIRAVEQQLRAAQARAVPQNADRGQQPGGGNPLGAAVPTALDWNQWVIGQR